MEFSQIQADSSEERLNNRVPAHLYFQLIAHAQIQADSSEKRLNNRVPAHLYFQLIDHAQALGVSMNAWVLDAIQEKLQRSGPPA